MIKLSLVNNDLAITILQGPNWTKDKDKLKALGGTRPIYEGDKFKYWLVKRENLEKITREWRASELLIESPELVALMNPSNIRNVSMDALPPIEDNLTFSKEPRSYQERFIRLNKSKTRLLLALDLGLGKTFSSLERIRLYNPQKVLVICPKAALANWRSEIYEAYDEKALIFHGNAPQRAKLLEDLNYKFIICTYETVKELNNYCKNKFNFDQIIVDEAHLACNSKSQRFIALKDTIFSNSNSGLLLLSGSPIQHKIKDLWALLYLIDPIFAGSEYDFINRYQEVVKSITKWMYVKDRNGKLVTDAFGKPKAKSVEIPIIFRDKNLDELRERLKSVMFRVTREDFVNFEDQSEIVTVELTKGQRRLYDSLKDEIRIELSNKTLDLKNALTRMLRLLQAAEGLFNFDETSTESGKLDYITDKLDNIDEKVIVWSRFQPLTKILGDKYKDSVIYNGDMSDNYKTLAKWAFNGVTNKVDLEHYKELLKKVKDFPFGPGEAKKFFGVINARSSLAMNLHKNCAYQILSSFDFMGSANEQSAGRLKRLDQESNKVLTEYLVAEDTIERKVLNLILNNYSKALQVIDGKESHSYKLTNEIIKLLKL